MPPNPAETLGDHEQVGVLNSNVANVPVLRLQVGVYLGKRDFVDRVDCVDPVGELDRILLMFSKMKED